MKRITIGDFIRQELKNPESELSQAKTRLAGWKYLIKNNRKLYIKYFAGRFLLLKGRVSFDNCIDKGSIDDVGDLYRNFCREEESKIIKVKF